MLSMYVIDLSIDVGRSLQAIRAAAQASSAAISSPSEHAEEPADASAVADGIYALISSAYARDAAACVDITATISYVSDGFESVEAWADRLALSQESLMQAADELNRTDGAGESTSGTAGMDALFERYGITENTCTAIVLQAYRSSVLEAREKLDEAQGLLAQLDGEQDMQQTSTLLKAYEDHVRCLTLILLNPGSADTGLIDGMRTELAGIQDIVEQLQDVL